ncbi:MAG: RICIN domain-containing protein [Ginsengibacter sp.]
MKKTSFLILIVIALLISGTCSSQIIKGTYAIKNVQTGMLLRIKDANQSDGTPLVAYIPQDWKCMTWDFNHIDGNTYSLKNLFTGKTFQAIDKNPSSGDVLKQQPISNTDNQLYEFIPVKENVYLIKLKGTDLYVTPSKEDGKINAPIIFSKKSGSKMQQWSIYEQHPDI